MLCIQDECFGESLHLDEVLLSSVPTASAGGAAFAFASSDGLNAIFGSNEFREYYKYNKFTLVVGMDAVTNENSLARATELVKQSRGSLDVRVYLTDNPRSIFHPKFAWFKDQREGGSVSLVGSGNLTLQGLQTNVEAFSWESLSEQQIRQTMRTWENWLRAAESEGRLFEITDDKVLKRAERNSRRRRIQPDNNARGREKEQKTHSPHALDVLISGIPKQTGRGWSQFNMKKEYFETYFGFDSEDTSKNIGRRILLQQVLGDGTVQPAESRPGVISSTSSNYRIELDGARDIPENLSGMPLVCFAKGGERYFRYQILLPEDALYAKTLRFADGQSASRPKNQLPKCLVGGDAVREALPELPLLAPADATEEDDGI